MEKILKFMGTVSLAVAALILVVGPTSLCNVAVEEIPESMKKRR
ncbi:MAG: hypothetical protein ABRQ25_10625 [Clostridiaceae bacterium]